MNTQIADATDKILEAFRTGEMAKPMAQVFLTTGRHAERWSFNNQMIVAVLGHEDAATYNQWQDLGRQVQKGTKAFFLMRPNVRTAKVIDDETGEEKTITVGITGFSWFPVHGLEDTKPIPGKASSYDEKASKSTQFVEALPLFNVAQEWGLKVSTFSGNDGTARGFAAPGTAIGLGVENLSTWAHEMIHQAEHRMGRLTKRGQDREQEIVAELGGAVLLTVLGYEAEADWGGAFEYIRSYAREKDGEGLLAEIMQVTGRMSDAVAYILEQASA